LDQLKRGLQESSMDTIHPRKLAQKSEINDVTQNIFSMTMKQDQAKKQKEQLHQYEQRGVTGSSLGYSSIPNFSDEMLYKTRQMENNATQYFNST